MELQVFSYLTTTVVILFRERFQVFANTQICLIICRNMMYIFKYQTKYFSTTIHKFAYDICTIMGCHKLIVAYKTKSTFIPLIK